MDVSYRFQETVAQNKESGEWGIEGLLHLEGPGSWLSPLIFIIKSFH